MMSNTKVLAIVNAAVLGKGDGLYRVRNLTLDEARALLDRYGDHIESYVGHQSTADLMSTLLGREVKMKRTFLTQEVGQTALIFKLDGRPEEGKIYSVEEIEAMGYYFQALEKLE